MKRTLGANCPPRAAACSRKDGNRYEKSHCLCSDPHLFEADTGFYFHADLLAACPGRLFLYSYRSSLIEDAIASSRTNVSFIMEQLDGEIKTLHYAALSVLRNDTLKNFDSYSKEPMPDAMFRLKEMMKEISDLENSFLPLESL